MAETTSPRSRQYEPSLQILFSNWLAEQARWDRLPLSRFLARDFGPDKYLCMYIQPHCSLHGRRLKGKGKEVLGARETPGAREEGEKEKPARRPLFSPSRLLIMYAKITQLWMTSCQISLAAKRLFLAFVFLKQEIWSEGTYYKKKVQMRSSVERRKLQRWVTCYIKSSINLLRLLLKETCWTSQLACNVCLRNT